MTQEARSLLTLSLRVVFKYLVALELAAALPDPLGAACTGCCSNNPCIDVVTTCTPYGCFCEYVFNTDKCDDGNACTHGDRCDNGVCVGVPHTGGTCDDGSACTTSDTCSNGICVGTSNCDDANACTLDSCDLVTGTCIHAPACDDRNPCTRDSCDAVNGACTNDPTPGATCDDGSLCTRDDNCTTLVDGRILCLGTFNCDDGNPCTDDLCDEGVCVRFLISCEDFNACTLDSCDPATGCVHVPVVVCNDGNACTVDQCSPSTGCVYSSFLCDDGSACTVDTCDPATGCVFTGPPGEVGNLRFTDSTTLAWDSLPDALIYNTYRGATPATGGLASLGARAYSHECIESGDAQENGSTLTIDTDFLGSGVVIYYLVDGELACGEGTLGTASDGTLRPNPYPCPTPPP